MSGVSSYILTEYLPFYDLFVTKSTEICIIDNNSIFCIQYHYHSIKPDYENKCSQIN